MGTLCLREIVPIEMLYSRHTVFCVDHLWSRTELFSETLMQDDAYSLQSFPRDKTPKKSSNEGLKFR